MGKIVKSIVVAVPVDEAFAYVVDWRNVGKYQEELHDYRPASQRTTGDGARFTHKLLTPRGELEVEVLYSEYVENAGLTVTAIRGPRVIEHWSFASAEAPQQTTITYAVEYPLPSGASGGILNLFMLKGFWSKRMQKALHKLQELLEKA